MHQEASPLAAAVAAVGDRWSLLIVDALLTGPRRFGQLQEQVAGIAPNILSARLKRLEADGLVLAEAYSRRPPRFEYRLSGSGRELAGALRLLAHWGAGHGEETAPPSHRACGTPLEVRWYCPTCDTTTADGDDDGLRYL